MIDVNFSIISGKKQTLRLKSETTVEEAKQTLSFLVDSPPHTLTLLHKAQVLRESTKLGELDFSSRNFIAVGIRRKTLVMMKSKAFNEQQQVSPLKNIFGEAFDTVRQHFLENPSSVPILIAYIAHSDPINARLLTENPQILLRFLGISPEEFLNAINNIPQRVQNTPNQQNDNILNNQNNENLPNINENASNQPESQTQANPSEDRQNQLHFQVNTETIYSRNANENNNTNNNNTNNNITNNSNNNNNNNNSNNNSNNNNNNNNNNNINESNNESSTNNNNRENDENQQQIEVKSKEAEEKEEVAQNNQNENKTINNTKSDNKNENENKCSSGGKKVASTGGDEADVDIAAFLDSMTPEDLRNLEMILSANVSLEEAIPVFLRMGKNVEATINELKRSH